MADVPDAPARAQGSGALVPHCPFCRGSHGHFRAGVFEAPCGRGVYRVIICLAGGETKIVDSPRKPLPARKTKK